MEKEVPTYVDIADRLLSKIEAESDVAYAEVSGIRRVTTNALLTEENTRHIEPLTETGAWCRPFVDGAADYRYTTVLDDEALFDMADRATRSARYLAQSQPASYDLSSHRASHSSQAEERADTRSIDKKQVTLSNALEPLRDDNVIDRIRLSYTDAREDSVFMTSTGTALQTATDRAAVDLIIQLTDTSKIRRHLGTTAPKTLWNALGSFVADALADARRFRNLDILEIDHLIGTEVPTVLSSRAAGQLIHHMSHYFEADTHFMGLSPYEPGEQIGVDGLTIWDDVRPNSWPALAYDAEGRPTIPTTLVRDGRLVSLLHDTASATDTNGRAAGNVIPSLGYEQPPRIHARHINVAAGCTGPSELLNSTGVIIDRFGMPTIEDEIEDTQRDSWMPASSLYAKDISEYTKTAVPGHLRLPVAEGWQFVDGQPARFTTDLALMVEPNTFQQITAISTTRDTVTGICRKHRSVLPFAVTAPSIRLFATLCRQ